MLPSALERAIAEDKSRGHKPIAVVASAGTVNTGSIDPSAEIAAIAHSHDLWLHIDGAYGALAALAVPEKFRGLSEADSISLDPHKWLFQPLDCGCLLYRDPEIALRFHVTSIPTHPHGAIGIWVAEQTILGLLTQTFRFSSTAFWGHVGGFMTGCTITLLLLLLVPQIKLRNVASSPSSSETSKVRFTT
jgi:glutamate/tyrosine decarboxylase-like PLP-dependent enzyme